MTPRQRGGASISAFSHLCHLTSHRQRHCEIPRLSQRCFWTISVLSEKTQCRRVVPRRLAETNTNNSSCKVWPLKIKAPCCKSYSSRGDRIQWDFLGLTAASGCEGFPTLRDLTPSKLQFWCYQTTSTPWRCSLGASKPPAHPEDAIWVLSNHQNTLKM